jgi:hypothetical protein
VQKAYFTCSNPCIFKLMDAAAAHARGRRSVLRSGSIRPLLCDGISHF